ncbi:hypothetical protein [Campylobacter sp. RM16187]|uniref:hypothetical protein n=1 Tax=Campylobacter sp. RM16187 TaxID=1660063 RepID=UPI0021B5700D|nr:hypothetical protein [Campylobacter sp. RM16187]QKG28778.1 hypothetical protein CDOMF_0496 [Campylobacter sp. RM16187]
MAKQNQPLTTPEQEQRAREIYNALNQSNDLFEQRIKVIKTKKIEGKAKTDKDGNPIIDDFGEIQKWEDSYALTYVAMNTGGEHTTRITQQQFLELQEGEIYIANGKIEYRLYKDNYNSTPVIVFDKFVPAIELFVTAMLKFEGLKA